MTIKEITNLRKSGHLQEALAAAEYEFNQSSNNFTAATLFWCLYDISKQQTGDELMAAIESMKSLYNEYCAGDEYLQKALAAVESRALPHYSELKEALAKAKSGENIIVFHQQVTAWYNGGELSDRLYPDFGWLTYYALKQTDVGEAQKRKILLHQYLKLELPRPSALHSCILREAVKVEHNTPLMFRIRDFIRMWGLENLQDSDWEEYKTDSGITVPSLVEKLIGVYAKELKTDGVAAPDDFARLVDTALTKYPNSQNMPYFKARTLISQGKADEALTYYKELIMRFPSKAYQWSQISELVKDQDTKIGLLCKALSCGVDEEYLGANRLKLASLLLEKGMKDSAKCELEMYRATYQKKGWGLKPSFMEMYNSLASVTAAESNKPVYSEYAVKAEEFIYSSLPTVVAVMVDESQKDDRNRPGKKITTWLLRTEKNTLPLRKPAKFGLNKRTSVGTVFDVKLQDSRVVWIKEHIGSISLSWLKTVGGEAQLRTDKNGRKYAIISGTYVGEKLLKGVVDGQTINVLAIVQPDGRWKAITRLNS